MNCSAILKTETVDLYIIDIAVKESNMGLIKKLEQKKDFTAAEAAVADYILNDPEQIVDMGIVELARATYSSNAVIIRMCRKLEVSGYKEFRIALAADLEKNRRENADIEVNNPFSSTDSITQIMSSVADITCEAINACYSEVSPGKVDNAARILRRAERIFIYAAGDSYTASIVFANRMMKIGYTVIYPSQFLETSQMTTLATEKDAVLVISYSGSLMNTIKRELLILKSNKVPVILLSSAQSHPLTEIVISIPDKEHILFKAASYYSMAAASYILNCIYGRIYTLDLAKNKAIKDHADTYAYGGSGPDK